MIITSIEEGTFGSIVFDKKKYPILHSNYKEIPELSGHYSDVSRSLGQYFTINGINYGYLINYMLLRTFW